MLKDNLVMLRKLNGYSQEQIAEKIDISRQAYAKFPPAEKGKNIWGTVTLGDRGQIVIPKAARDHLGIKGGDRLIVASDEVGVALIPAELFESKMQEIMNKLSEK